MKEGYTALWQGTHCKRWSFKDLGLVDANTPETVCCTTHATVGWLIL